MLSNMSVNNNAEVKFVYYFTQNTFSGVFDRFLNPKRSLSLSNKFRNTVTIKQYDKYKIMHDINTTNGIEHI